jgi:AcrR family transcriptional regulator
LLLEMRDAARKQFLKYGVGTSLEAVAKEAGVGPGTLYRHFPTREALLAAVLQSRRQELETRRAEIEQIDGALGALRHWMRAMEEYFSAFSGLPEPLMAAARAQDPDNPLTIPCHDIIATTDECRRSAQGRFDPRSRETICFSRPSRWPGPWASATSTSHPWIGCADSSNTATARRATSHHRIEGEAMTVDTVFPAAPLMELLRSRRSAQQFLPTPMSAGDARAVLEEAQRAPSNSNTQPWRCTSSLGSSGMRAPLTWYGPSRRSAFH